MHYRRSRRRISFNIIEPFKTGIPSAILFITHQIHNIEHCLSQWYIFLFPVIFHLIYLIRNIFHHLIPACRKYAHHKLAFNHLSCLHVGVLHPHNGSKGHRLNHILLILDRKSHRRKIHTSPFLRESRIIPTYKWWHYPTQRGSRLRNSQRLLHHWWKHHHRMRRNPLILKHRREKYITHIGLGDRLKSWKPHTIHSVGSRTAGQSHLDMIAFGGQRPVSRDSRTVLRDILDFNTPIVLVHRFHRNSFTEHSCHIRIQIILVRLYRIFFSTDSKRTFWHCVLPGREELIIIYRTLFRSDKKYLMVFHGRQETTPDSLHLDFCPAGNRLIVRSGFYKAHADIRILHISHHLRIGR